QELDQLAGAGQLVEQGGGLGDAAATGQVGGVAQAPRQRGQGAFEQGEVDDGAVGQVHRAAVGVAAARVGVVQPLPQLGAGDLGGGRVLHHPVDRHAAVAVQPGGQVAHADLDVVLEALAGDRALAGTDQVVAADLHVLAQHVVLVGRGHVRIE